MCIPMKSGTATPLARDGLPILGAPIGTSAYCTTQIRKTITSIQRAGDLDLLSTFEFRHQRTKLALYCCNSAIHVLLQRVFQQSADYAHIDDWADFHLTDSAHASRSRHTSDNRSAFCLSNLAARAGLASSALQSDAPVAEEDTYRRDSPGP